MVSRKYNQRTKEWNSKVVKVKKQYEYIPVFMAKVLQLRKEDANKVTRGVPLNDSDPVYWHQQLQTSHHRHPENFFLQGKVDLKTIPTKTKEIIPSVFNITLL